MLEAGIRLAENPVLTNREFNRAFVLMQYFGYLRRNPLYGSRLTICTCSPSLCNLGGPLCLLWLEIRPKPPPQSHREHRDGTEEPCKWWPGAPAIGAATLPSRQNRLRFNLDYDRSAYSSSRAVIKLSGSLLHKKFSYRSSANLSFHSRSGFSRATYCRSMPF